MLQRSVVGAVLGAALCAIVFGVAIGPAQAEWPERPITLVVPYPAGGTAASPHQREAECQYCGGSRNHRS